jgi:hypothetical protein
VLKILRKLGAHAIRSDLIGRSFDESTVDIIAITDRRRPQMGIVLEQEALMLDYRTFTSYRVKSGNLGFWKDFRFLKWHKTIDRHCLRDYFLGNHDNPYGLYNVMNALHRGVDLVSLTQFPPLEVIVRSEEERVAAIQNLIAKARGGDLVFSGHPRDSVSSLLRRFDRCQFSHVGNYVGDGTVANLGPGGFHVDSLLDYPPETRIALYTLRDITQDQRAVAVETAMEWVKSGVKYSYTTLLLMFLRKRFRLKIAAGLPTVSDLLHANLLDLVDYV